MLAVVLAGAIVTYGGVSLFVAFFVLAPMAQGAFRGGRHPAPADAGGDRARHVTFTMSALPGTPAIQNAIPMPFFGTTPFAAPGLGIIASVIMLAFGLWWLGRAESAARRRAKALASRPCRRRPIADDEAPRARHRSQRIRSRRNTSRRHSETPPAVVVAGAAVVVILVNLPDVVVLPRMDFSFLAEERWGATSLSAVAGVWSVVVALAAGDPDCDRAEFSPPALVPREHGRRRQRFRAAGVQRREPRRLRRGGRRAAGLCHGARLGARRSAAVRWSRSRSRPISSPR